MHNLSLAIEASQHALLDDRGRAGKRESMKERPLMTGILALLLAVAFSATEMPGAVSTPQLPNPGDTGVSKQQQEQIGSQAVGEVYKQMPVLPDSSPETQYIRQLGQKLVAVIPEQYSWPYEFHVIPQKEINAFALPGGPIFVNIGTMTAADNEAELVGVLAHEMSHVYMQHSIKQMKKAQWTQGIAGVLGAVLGSVGGAVGTLGQLGAGIAGGVLTMKYSRDDEAQADAVGAIIMYKAGYDPHYMAQFFQKLASMGGSGPQFLSDHPNPGNREHAIGEEVQNWPPKNFVSDSPAFARAKKDAAGVRAYNAQEIADGAKSGLWTKQNRESGTMPSSVTASSAATSKTATGGSISSVTYRDVTPSGELTPTQNSTFAISYPNNWQLYQDQSGNGATIAPPAGVSEGAVAYGAVINIATPTTSSLDQATQDLISALERSNPGLRASGTPQPVRVNGIEGRSVDLAGPSPIEQDGKPVPEHDWLVVLPRSEGGMLYTVFIAPERDFSELRPTYENMLRSLHFGHTTAAPAGSPASVFSSSAAPAKTRKLAYELDVPGASQWTDTGIDLVAGDRVVITASGSIQTSAAQASGPEGLARGWRDLLRALPVNSAGSGALIGRIGDSAAAVPFLVGASKELAVNSPGRLFLGINQPAGEQSGGSFRVSVKLVPAETQAASPQPADTTGAALSNNKITAGLKEALTVSTGNAVASTGRTDGFLKNEAIKILLPDKLRTAGKGMRLMGMGAQLDELEVGMNRAAEQATPLAKQIFINAVKKMSFEDARKILFGGDTAATEYFKRQSTDQLTEAFTPIVHKSMENVGVVKQYDQLMQNSMLGSVMDSNFSLDKYVVGKTLDGLFYMLGEEEKRIRKDPLAQTTSLLKEVFGKKT
jgi:Zn-dependent protease with chaperone function